MQGAASPGQSERCRVGELLLAWLGQEEEEEGGGLVLRGVAMHHAAVPALRQHLEVGDGQHGLVGFVLLTRGVSSCPRIISMSFP